MSVVEDLEKMQKLKEQGILTETEFEAEKQKILGKDVKKEQVTNNVNKAVQNISQKIKKNKTIHINKTDKQHKKKFCSNCGNEIQGKEKFCGKCGNKVKYHNTKKIKQLVIILIIIFVILIGGFVIYTNFKNNSNVITEEELIQMIKETEYGIYYEENSIKIGPIIDYNYEEYNKLITYSCIYTNDNNEVTLNAGELMLYNTENESYKKIELDGDFLSIIYYLNTSNMTEELESVINLLGQYFKENGIENFGISNNTDKYLNLGKEVGQIVGVQLCRNICNDYITSMNNYSYEVTFLYKEGEIYPRYIGMVTSEQKYMWSSIIPEYTYKAMIANNSSSNRNYINVMTQMYGEPYKTVTKFSVYSFTSEDISLQGSYESLDAAKEKLEVEE